MQYPIFVQNSSNQRYVASVIGIPECRVEGSTKAEAIAKAKTVLEEKVANGEIITVEIQSSPASYHQHAGIFADDPTFDDFLSKLDAIRQAANAMQDE